MNGKSIFLSLLLIVGVIATSFFTYKVVNKNIAHYKHAQQSMDFYIRDAHFVETDVNGKPTHYLDSTLVTHYPEQNLYRFKNPHIKTFDSQNDIWFVTAKNGETTHGSDKIHMWGNVIIRRPQLKDPSKQLKITTNSATFYPKQHCAITHELATLTQPGSVVKSVGAKTDFKNRKVKLFSQIESEFKPD